MLQFRKLTKKDEKGKNFPELVKIGVPHQGIDKQTDASMNRRQYRMFDSYFARHKVRLFELL